MIKIFRGTGVVTPSKPPPPMNSFCLYPPPILRCFWKGPLMTPTPHHPTSSTFHCYPPPHPPPLPPPKNFDHTPDNVMFVRDFNWKLESFDCAKKNAPGPMLKNIQKQLNLIYLNNDEHTHMDRSKGSTDLLDIAFISPNLAKHDIQFQIGDNVGSDHLPIEVPIDAPPHRNSSINHTKYKFDQTEREVFESTHEAVLGSMDFTRLFVH